MSQKYIVDSCIWRDFYEDRMSKSGRSLGKEASVFLLKVLKERDTILFSDELIKELRIRYSELEINDMFRIFQLNNLLRKIEMTREESIAARKLVFERKLPFADCLNAVQAKNHDATLISQDRHILINLKDIAKVSKP
jgi:predicted nucleic acid-binding protein